MIGDPRNGLPRTRILGVILITENINGKIYILMGGPASFDRALAN
ncbi:MAG: hypothetical protein ACM3MB_05460 [Acidobacteriota bacterium]